MMLRAHIFFQMALPFQKDFPPIHIGFSCKADTCKQAFRSMISQRTKGSKRLEEQSINGSNIRKCLVHPKYRMVLFCDPRSQLPQFSFRKSGNHCLLWEAQFLRNTVILKSEISPLLTEQSSLLYYGAHAVVGQTGKELGPSSTHPVSFHWCNLGQGCAHFLAHSTSAQWIYIVGTINIKQPLHRWWE